ncbi:MAG: hypothetical protein U0361_03420 [Nitrospiraceae bacterium]
MWWHLPRWRRLGLLGLTQQQTAAGRDGQTAAAQNDGVALAGRKRARLLPAKICGAMRVGDIITIVIVEKHKGSKSVDTSAEKDSTITNSFVRSALGYLGIPAYDWALLKRRGYVDAVPRINYAQAQPQDTYLVRSRPL